MSDVPIVHTAQPLVPLSDDEIVDRAELPSWALTEALFWLGGYRSPGYESDRHMQDHFWNAYTQAMGAIELGDLCQKIERAGETVFIDRPGNWLVWADKIGPKYIKVDERMLRALSQTTDNAASPAPVSQARGTVPTAGASQPDAVTGGVVLGKQENSKRRKTRRSEPETDAVIKSRIKSVLLAANNKWPTTEELPPTAYQAAKKLVDGEPGNRLYKYSEVTVRKILAGTYSSMKKHGLTGRY